MWAAEDETGDEPLEAVTAATTWVRWARRRPALARVLYDAERTLADAPVGPWRPWMASFTAQPPWAILATLPLPAVQPTDDHLLARAALAQELAGHLDRRESDRRPNPEHLYWSALVAEVAAAPTEAWSANPGLRCVQAAEVLLTVRALAKASAPRLAAVPLAIGESFPTLSAHDLIRLAEEAVAVTPEPLTRRDWLFLRQGAEVAALRDQERQQAGLLLLAAADTPDRLLERAADLVRDLLPGPFALWLPPAGTEGIEVSEPGGEAGSGYAWVASESRRWSAARVSFEDALPGALRQAVSVQLGPATGWLYLPTAQSARRLQPVLATLARRWMEVADRDSLRRQLAAAAAHRQRVQEQTAQAAEQHHRGAIREFAAGAGHEINNPLGTIRGQAERLMQHETDPDRRHALKQILAQVGRVHWMIRDLHLLGADPVAAVSRFAVADLIDAAAAQALKRASVREFTLAPVPDNWQLTGRREHLVRLLTEILTNGLEAAGEAGWVRLQVDRDEVATS